MSHDLNRPILHQPTIDPTLNPTGTDRLWWLGRGIYYRQTDGLWLHATCRLASMWTDSRYLDSWIDAAALVPSLVHAYHCIESEVRRLGLGLEPSYLRLNSDQCQQLVRIAEAWHLAYAWTERETQRHFRKPLRWILFTWNISKE